MNLKLISIFFAITFYTAAYSFGAAELCSGFYTGNPSLKLRFDSSVEVEIEPTPGIVELFTTKDGTIGPVLGKNGIDVIPESILQGLKDYVGEGGDVRAVPWDVLTPSEKVKLIASASVGNDFRQSRKIPGLLYRKEVFFTFNKPTRFIGKDFKPGHFKFLSSDIFADTAIEYMGPNRMQENLGLEIHVRSSLLAGENLITARVLQTVLSGGQANVHLHMVGPVADPVVPNKWQRILHFLSPRHRAAFDTKNEAEVFLIADLARRTMLYFDIQMIQRGIPMTSIKNSEGTGTNFFPVDHHDFYRFASSLVNGALGNEVRSKSGTVGLRTSHYYDQLGVWGMEVRYLSPLLDPKLTEAALNFFQKKIISGQYFMSRSAAIDHLSSKSIDFNSSILGLLYVSDFSQNLKRAKLNEDQVDFILAEVKKNDFIKMLFHDWSNDPIYSQNKDRLTQLQAAQKLGIALLLGGMPSVDVMKLFIKKSAMAYDLNKVLFN